MVGNGTLGDRPDREYWRIDGAPVAQDPTEESRTFESLEVTFEVTLGIVQEIRSLRQNAGSFNVLPRSDGGFVAIDTADGQNTHTVESPASRQSVRRQLEWLVDDYDEEMLDQTGERYEIALELVPQRSKRQYDGHVDDARAVDDWLFEFDAGDVATQAVDSEIREMNTDGVETIGLDLVLSGPQVRKLEESVRRLAAVQVTEQFDGSPRAEDNSPGRVNTFYLDPPEGGDKTVEPGHYVVSAFETTWMSDNVYQVGIDALAIDVPAPFDAETFTDDFDTTAR